MVPVNVCWALSLAAEAVAVTVLALPVLLKEKPLPELTVKPHEPLPEPAGETVIVQRVTEVGPVIATVVSVDANPEAVAVTVTPVGPEEGLSVRLATVPVNVAVAVSLAGEPVAVTVFALPPLLKERPFAVLAVKLHEPPPPLTEIEHNSAEPIFTLIVVSVDANPEAVAVTVIPEGPDAGLSVSADVVPVNVCWALSLATFPVAVTVFAVPPLLNVNPFAALAVNVHEPLPPLAEMLHREVDPIFTAIDVSVDANPDPLTVTVTPLGPEIGESTRLATVPVNVVVCVSPAWFPVAVTTTVLPALLNVKPVEELATKEHGC